MLSINKKLNQSAYNLLHNTVSEYDGKDGSTFAFISGEIHALFLVNALTPQQYNELNAELEKKFYTYPLI